MSNYSRVQIFKHFVSSQFSDQNMSDNNNSYQMSRSLSRPKPSKYKWTTLSHNGVKFPEEYIQKNIPIIYDGRELLLTKDAEEIAFLYAKYVDTEYVTNSTFNKNFFNDWRKILGKDHIIQNLSQCDFSIMKKYLLDEKEKRKGMKKELSDVDQDEKYKTAMIDGKPQSITNYKMEPPGIFIGRGKNPHLGKVKKRIYPEDITINIDKESTVPTPPDGHKWGEIIHDRTVEWLASWKDTITGKTKYLWLSAHSDQKTSNDQRKYDLAKKLKKKIKTISETNTENMSNPDIKIRQIATAMYFIDKLAIRVGNEKGEDEADTVGASSLRVEHVDISERNKITLNFLGKDSVPYTNTIIVDDLIYNNVVDFIKDKNQDDQIFDKISSNDINKYLQEFMKDLTAKVFRTYNASILFQRELNKITKRYDGMDHQENMKAILDDFSKANAKVAKMMNHQKNISSGYKKTVSKVVDTINKLKKNLAKARRSKKKSQSKIAKIKEKIKNYKSKLELVKEMKNISLGTSKANYIDPRITVAFMKKHDIDVNKIFSKALQEKFKWAFEVDENYKF